MSSRMGEEMCPLCDGEMLTSFYTIPHDFVDGICLECGYCYWTEPGIISLERLNQRRRERGLEPLKEIRIDLKALDELRLDLGLEPMKQVLKNWKDTLRRIKKEVIDEEIGKKEI
jgi:hypothetical protein